MATIEELLELGLHEEYAFKHRVVIRVPGGWIYETETHKNGAYPGGMTSCFVPEPNMLTNDGFDEWLKTVEPDMPEPDYDKTLESEKTFLTMGIFN